MAGARRLGGAASAIFDAGKTTPGITPPKGVGLVPGEPPYSPEWSTDAGATPSDPDDDILALVWETLTLFLTVTRDALTLYPRSPPTPELLQGTRWELGMVDLVTGPKPLGDKVRTSGTRQRGGLHVRTLPHCGAHPPPRSYPGQPAHQDAATPQGPRTRGEPVSPETKTGVIRAPTPTHENHDTPKDRDKAPVGEPPGLARDGPR